MITAIVLTQNEATNIKACLKTILWCQKIIIVDNSQDQTLKIATATVPSSKLTIIKSKNNYNFAYLRNLGLKKTTTPWAFFVDADHRVPTALKKEIQKTLPQTKFNAFKIRQLDFLFNQQLNYGETAHIYHTLLAKKTAGHWSRAVHEKWLIKPPIKILTSPIHHYPHQTIAEFIDHLNRWSTLDAKAFLKAGQAPQLWRVFVYPPAKFFLNYFFRLGFLDGFPGLTMALLMSFHSLLVRLKMLEPQS